MKKRYLVTSLLCAAVLGGTTVIGSAGQWQQPILAAEQAGTVDNQYINAQHFTNPPIKTVPTTFTHWNAYRHGVGKPEGIVIHETADPGVTLDQEVTRMQTQWQKRQAYVHAFVDHSEVVNIHPTDYAVWGAGYYANQRFIHIELVEENNAYDFAESVNNDAYYVATLLKKYNLPAVLADHDGQGTIWSHHAVSQWLGDTDHTDPTGYFQSWGYSMDDFFALVQQKLAELNHLSGVVQVKNSNGVPLWNGYGAAKTATGRTLRNNSRWKVTAQTVVDGAYWYQVGANQWIEATDTNWPNGYGNPASTNTVVKVQYKNGASIALWNGYGDDKQFSGRYLKNGSAWRVTKQAFANGEYWYQVATNQWIEGRFTNYVDGLAALK